MKKFIFNSLLFFISTAVIYLAVFAVLFFIKVGNTPLVYRATQGNVWKGGGTYIKTHEFKVDEMHDIIIVGSSHAYRGYDPRIFEAHGFSTYNLGTSDQKVLCSYFLVKNYINRNNCKLVIFDLYDRVFSQTNIESNSDLIQNIPSDKAALQISIASDDVRAINMFTLRLFNKIAPPLDHDTSGYINGYLPTTKFLTLPPKRRDYNYKTNEESLYYLDLMLDYLQQEGVKVVMAEHSLPIVSPAPNHEQFRKDVLKVLNKYNVQWFDYTNYTPLTAIEYFADESHLNVNGVAKFNQLLIKDLIKAKILVPKNTNDAQAFNPTKE